MASVGVGIVHEGRRLKKVGRTDFDLTCSGWRLDFQAIEEHFFDPASPIVYSLSFTSILFSPLVTFTFSHFEILIDPNNSRYRKIFPVSVL